MKADLRRLPTALVLAALLTSCTGAEAVPTIPYEPIGPTVSGEPRSATDGGENFSLTISSSKDRYRAGELIDISAELTNVGPDPVLEGSGSGTLVGFGLESVDGRIKVEPLFTADCARHRFVRGEPDRYPFVKSGSSPDGDPMADFYDAYFSSRELRLPAGTWTISAQTTVYPTGLCDRSPDRLLASVTIEVEP